MRLFKPALKSCAALLCLFTLAFQVAGAADWKYYATRQNGQRHYYDQNSIEIITSDGHTLAYVTVKTDYTPQEHIAYLGRQYEGTVTSMTRELIDCSSRLNKTVLVHLFNYKYEHIKKWRQTEQNITPVIPGTIADLLYRSICPVRSNVLDERGYY